VRTLPLDDRPLTEPRPDRLDRSSPGAAAALAAHEAALGVVRVVNAGMERALRAVSVERGFDPRGCTLVTFGGAYAVLAYVTQAVTVAPYNWLSPAQAVDGLALAETTPGPLIMVLQFVGFTAGWNHPPTGMSPLASGVVGALVTTYVTFLPCFVFIFVGAPYIEVVRGNRALAGALAGVTAAVVGVILNLALVFGAAVIWPQGFAGGPDWFAASLGAAAFLALYRLRADVLWVVLAGGLLGLARSLLFR